MGSICDTCKRNNYCRKPWDGMDYCRLYISDKKSNYDLLFGTPEKMAEYIIENCSFDCTFCMMPIDIPCHCSFDYNTPGDYDTILDWLKNPIG